MENYNELYHYGIKGMKWGVRRYQNADGSLTPAGKKRINKLNDLDRKNDLNKDYRNMSKRNINRFGDKNDPVSKFLTMTNSKNISRLDKTIERNKEQINKIIDDVKSQKVDLVVGYNPHTGRMNYKQSDEQRIQARVSKLSSENRDAVSKLANKHTIQELESIRDNAYKTGDKYRGKAYGTGNILDGTYKPPKDDSDEAFAANMRKSDQYYRDGDRADLAIRILRELND